jgi:hypothetical protein
MEETIDAIDNPVPNGKLFKDRAFWVGTFLGGPLVAGYLFSENFKVLGESEKVKPTWIITIVATIFIFGGIFLIPDNINIPNQIIPIAYTAIAFGLFKKYQKEKTDIHINKGGLIHSWWKVIGVSVISLLITLLPVFAYVYKSDPYIFESVSTQTYGTTVKHEIDFVEKNISSHEVDEIADAFIATGFFDLSVEKYVYLEKNDTDYVISISVIQGTGKDSEALQPFIELRNQMDDYFPQNSIQFNLVVDYLDNVVKVLK